MFSYNYSHHYSLKLPRFNFVILFGSSFDCKIQFQRDFFFPINICNYQFLFQNNKTGGEIYHIKNNRYFKSPIIQRIMGNNGAIVGKDWQNTISLAIDIPVPFSTLIKNEQLFQLLLIPHQTRQDKAKLTIKHLQGILGDNVKIVEASRYKVPLSQKQYTSLLFYHEYIIVKTEAGQKIHFWAFEKNSKHIRITFASNLDRVVNFGYGETQGSIQKRLKGTYWTPIKIQSKKANFDLYELIKWAYLSQIQKQKYHLFDSNCKSFSRSIFKLVTNDSR